MERDSLTGLYNKAYTQHYIQTLLRDNPSSLYAFFILDIDSFKQVNDNCGHAFGDMVIAGFSDILKKQFRHDDIVGRIGGDEFAVFVSVPSMDWVRDKARTLVQELHHEFVNDTCRRQVSVSIGIAIAPYAGTDFDVLYKNADLALYQTKEKGKNGFTIYSS